jgi:hypothetical protein
MGKGSQILLKNISRRLKRFYLVIRMFGANDSQQMPWSSMFSVIDP